MQKSQKKHKFLKSPEKTQIKKPSQLCYETASFLLEGRTVLDNSISGS
jgi:hypothetical protein